MSSVSSAFNDILKLIYDVLPKSPFASFINNLRMDDSFNTALGYLNWFLPIKEMIAILSAFCAIVVIYYVYQAILRIVRVLQ